MASSRLLDIRVGKNRLEKLAISSKGSFRTLRVFICTVCGSKTNHAENNEGISVPCPNISEQWHQILVKKLYLLREYHHPKSYLKELKKEIDVMKENHPPKNNIKGKTRGLRKMFCYADIYRFPEIW